MEIWMFNEETGSMEDMNKNFNFFTICKKCLIKISKLSLPLNEILEQKFLYVKIAKSSKNFVYEDGFFVHPVFEKNHHHHHHPHIYIRSNLRRIRIAWRSDGSVRHSGRTSINTTVLSFSFPGTLVRNTWSDEKPGKQTKRFAMDSSNIRLEYCAQFLQLRSNSTTTNFFETFSINESRPDTNEGN
ncbi:hypothetical protein BLOT_007788 [Blomia tropicalis]|nr:hypothetical protein BLOT_007788 [Blomia tropicalis]